MKQKYFSALVLLIAGAYYGTNTYAQEVSVLDEIVLTDNKKASPLQLSIINNNLSKRKNHDAGSLFYGIPGFGIDKKGGYAMDPVFRGFKNEQLNIQFDGGTTVAPACPNRMDPVTTHITPEEVEKIEIIKGPYSVRFGSSLGGVINLVTKIPEFNPNKIYRGSIEGGYEANGSSWFSGVKASVVKEKWLFQADGAIKRFGNYESGNGQEIIASFNTNDYALKAGYKIDPTQQIRVSFRQSFGRDIMHPGLPMDTDIDNSTVSTIDYDNRLGDGFFRNVKAKMYYADVEHVMSNDGRPSVKKMGLATSTTYSQTLGGKLEMEMGLDDDNLFYLGMDLRNISNQGETVKVKNDVEVGRKQVWQDSYVNDYGLFAQYNLHVNDKFSVQTGVRMDYIQSDTKDPDPKFEHGNLPEGVHPDDEVNFSANISGAYWFSNVWNTKLSIGRGVQTASIQKRYVNTLPVGRDAFYYIGNPMLNAEVNNQIDLSFNRVDDNWWFGLNGYYSIVENYINSEIVKKPQPGIPGVKKFINIDEANIYGFEASFGFQIVEFLKLDVSGFYTHAQNIDLDEPLAEIPPMEANVSLMYDNQKWYAKVNQRLVDEQDRVAVSVSETTSPGFGVMDVFGGYEINKHIRLDASVTNVFNLNYYDHLNRPYKNMDSQSEYYNMGRNFMISAKLSL